VSGGNNFGYVCANENGVTKAIFLYFSIFQGKGQIPSLPLPAGVMYVNWLAG